jgi:hypothetical protein
VPSQDWIVVRSSGLSSVNRPASSGKVSSPRREATLTVECSTRTSKVLPVRTVATTFLTSSARSIERTPVSWELVVGEQERRVLGREEMIGDRIADGRTGHGRGTFS